jgi:hypothetical protein
MNGDIFHLFRLTGRLKYVSCYQTSVHLRHSLHLSHSAESVYDHTLQHPYLYLPHLILSIFNLLVPTCLSNLRSGADVDVIVW